MSRVHDIGDVLIGAVLASVTASTDGVDIVSPSIPILPQMAPFQARALAALLTVAADDVERLRAAKKR